MSDSTSDSEDINNKVSRRNGKKYFFNFCLGQDLRWGVLYYWGGNILSENHSPQPRLKY